MRANPAKQGNSVRGTPGFRKAEVPDRVYPVWHGGRREPGGADRVSGFSPQENPKPGLIPRTHANASTYGSVGALGRQRSRATRSAVINCGVPDLRAVRTSASVRRAISPKSARPRARLLSPWMTEAHSKWTFKRSSTAFYPTAALSPAHLDYHQHRITIRQLPFLARLEGQCPEQFVAFVYRVHTFFAQGGFRLPVGA